MNIFRNKKFRYGSVSIALCAVIVAAVILVNAIFTALANKYLWFVDMTPAELFTLSDSAAQLLKTVDENAEVVITFCAERDQIEGDGTMRFPYYTAVQMEEKFDNISVRYVDINVNPSAVADAKKSSNVDITTQSIIVSSGTEHRVYSVDAMYVTDDAGDVVAYGGEQKLVSGILSVTKVERPIVCFTVNHGESANANMATIKSVMEDSGCEVRDIDLLMEEIPAGCRIVVVVDPQDDFSAKSEGTHGDEIRKLENFLAANGSLMVFMDNATPYVSNFETFLEGWGIGVARDHDFNDSALLVRDKGDSLDDEGYKNIGVYTEDEAGLGVSLSDPLVSDSNRKSVIFPMSAVFYNPELFQSQKNDNGYWEGVQFTNAATRHVVNVFTSANDAEAMVGGATINNKQLEELYGLSPESDMPFSYMKLAYEAHTDENGNEQYGYVLACASTEFAVYTEQSAYGNHKLLSYATSVLSRENTVVSIDYKYFQETTISTITAQQANAHTLVLTIVPASVILLAGLVIIIRRKFS